jgi:hypothetical protein
MALFKTDGLDGNAHRPSKFATVYCTGAITAGNVATLDLTDDSSGYWFLGQAVEQADAIDDPMACGVACKTLTAAGELVIQISGYNTATTCDDSVATTVGELVGSATSGGDGRVSVVGTIASGVWPFAVCVDAHTVDTADGAIMIIDKGWFSAGN